MTEIADTDASRAFSSLQNWIHGLVALLLIAGLTACQSDEERVSGDEAADETARTVVEVTAADYAFVAPDTIPAGWVTFRMVNRGEESHHFHLDRLAEGVTVAQWREAIKEPLDSLNQLLAENKIDSTEARNALMKAFDRATPDSMTELTDMHPQTHGGVGLVAPGRTGQTTHHVDPGHYVMICVIRAPSGRTHAGLGMAHGLVAVDSSAGGSPPSPDVTVQGDRRKIRMDGDLSVGTQTIGFGVKDVPEGLRSGTDGYYSVWLARLADTTDISDVAAWEYTNPAPYESLGGFEYLPPNETAYLTADIEPGRYAWIWFYDGMDLLGADEPMVEAFTVE